MLLQIFADIKLEAGKKNDLIIPRRAVPRLPDRKSARRFSNLGCATVRGRGKVDICQTRGAKWWWWWRVAEKLFASMHYAAWKHGLHDCMLLETRRSFSSVKTARIGHLAHSTRQPAVNSQIGTESGETSWIFTHFEDCYALSTSRSQELSIRHVHP